MGSLRRTRRQSSRSERRGCQWLLRPSASKPRQPYTMTAQLVTIEKASPTCLNDVLEILSQVNLPHAGVKEHFGGFLIARSGAKILGCAGLERHGEIGLLRSAAVLSEYQGLSIGNKLVLELLKRAASA